MDKHLKKFLKQLKQTVEQAPPELKEAWNSISFRA